MSMNSYKIFLKQKLCSTHLAVIKIYIHLKLINLLNALDIQI